jgi:hypothetical protein
MTIHARHAGLRLHLTDTAAPACFRSKRAEATDGLALSIAMKRNAFSEALLLARREALASTARHLRNQMRNREASLAMAELRAVTLQLLAAGER